MIACKKNQFLPAIEMDLIVGLLWMYKSFVQNSTYGRVHAIVAQFSTNVVVVTIFGNFCSTKGRLFSIYGKQFRGFNLQAMTKRKL